MRTAGVVRFGLLSDRLFVRAPPRGGPARPGDPAAPRPLLGFDSTLTLEPTDRLVLVARDADDGIPTADRSRDDAAIAPAAPRPAREGAVARVLLLGWSPRAPALLCELDRYGPANVAATAGNDGDLSIQHLFLLPFQTLARAAR